MRSLSSQCASLLLVLSLVRVARVLVGLRGSCLVMLVLPLTHLVLAGNFEFVGCRCVLKESGNRSAVNPFLFPFPVALTDFADLLVVTGGLHTACSEPFLGTERERRYVENRQGKQKGLKLCGACRFGHSAKLQQPPWDLSDNVHRKWRDFSTGVEKQCTSVKVMHVAQCK